MAPRQLSKAKHALRNLETMPKKQKDSKKVGEVYNSWESPLQSRDTAKGLRIIVSSLKVADSFPGISFAF